MGGGVRYTEKDERVLSSLVARADKPSHKQITSLFNERRQQNRSDSSIRHKILSIEAKVGLDAPPARKFKPPKTKRAQPTAESTKRPKSVQPRCTPVTEYGKDKGLGQRGLVPCDRFGRRLDRKRKRVVADSDKDSDGESDSDLEFVHSEPETVPSSSPTPTIRASSPVPPRDFERSAAPAPSSRHRPTSPAVTKERSSSRDRSATAQSAAAGSSVHAALSAPTSQAAGTQTQPPPAPGTAQVDTGTATQTDDGAQTVEEEEACLMAETMKVARNYESAAAAGETWCAMQRKKLAGERIVEAINA